MKNLYGIQSGMVMQRDERNECVCVIGAACCGMLRTSLGSLTPLDNGRYQLRGIPTGGPYALTLSDDEGAASFDHLYVGDVWLLGGQSNMEGVGYIEDDPGYRPSPLIRSLRMDNQWVVAHPILHQYWLSPYPVYNSHESAPAPGTRQERGVGPGYYLAQEMLRRTGVPQGLISGALGGSCMGQWNPDRAPEEKGNNLYWTTMERVRLGGGRVRGIFWYQGCSEANEGGAGIFVENMKRMVAAFRRDLEDAQLPFVQVQICRFTLPFGEGSDIWWNRIRELQRTLDTEIPVLDTVAVTNASMTDGIHISAASQMALGKNAAESMFRFCFDPEGKSTLFAPALERIFIATGRPRFGGAIGVRYRNIHGVLRADGVPTGFALSSSPSRIDMAQICRVELEGNTVYLRHELPEERLPELYCSYFFGTDSYANITDGAMRPLPAFGPLSLVDIRKE